MRELSKYPPLKNHHKDDDTNGVYADDNDDEYYDDADDGSNDNGSNNNILLPLQPKINVKGLFQYKMLRLRKIRQNEARLMSLRFSDYGGGSAVRRRAKTLCVSCLSR